ncbi:MAG: universal stress protein [Dehalococcoidia bacterium]|nr:universal stress protein [Dehalococcoidia bacterium]
MKRILLPLDGSRVGEAAVPYAEYLALKSGAELVLFQVIETVATGADAAYAPPYRSVVDGKLDSNIHEQAFYPSQVMENRRALAKAYLDDMEKQLREKGVNASTAIDFGIPADRIVDYAGTKDIDLIAMSTHGRSGLARWFAGSVTDKVLHAGDTPVLVVRPPKEKEQGS